MTDKKFTQKEVIKALELCTNKEIFVCDQCVFQKYKMGHDGCLAEMLPSTLNLIHRLKTRIVRYQLKNTNQRNALASLNKKVAEQKAEIERLQEELKITRTAVHNNGLEWGLISIKKLVDDTKTEAIKKFAERLKEENNNRAWFCGIFNHDIDNFVKEMTEERNNAHDNM